MGEMPPTFNSVKESQTMPKNSLAEVLAVARQMLAGLNANAEAVAARGVTAAFTANGQVFTDSVQSLENEQETLKAALKTKTAELEAATEQLKNWQSEANSTVKLVYRTQPEKWGEFGIKAKR
jgi:Tfp pilus assembly protein PilV